MGWFKSFIANIIDSIKKRMSENKEIRDLERKGFLDERKEAAYARGKKAANYDPYQKF